ncbi:hypothetical protein ASG87_04415 [Frateuria sp. Soil773]|uniref:SdpI family protein n=1 Tax=Frateuria sp. Soil773 TaxID=1736407 RepID=UPI0006FEDD62|nr:SdpI family protein [Frateuria sp. Soil773]KRE89575.1 hypothetical protein ASG87_04415 [Frateuria sp. Soil773]
MTSSRNLIVSAAFVLIAAAVGLWVYPQLPAQVPTHWDLHGQPTQWTPRFWSAALPAIVLAALAALTEALPRLSPRRFEIRPFARSYGIIMLAVQGAILVIDLSILLGSAGYALPRLTIGMLSIGVLLMVIGNYMGKLRRNFFVGIRTPWTLTNDAVWERTHRLGGRVSVLAGLLIVAAALAGAPKAVPVALLAAACLVPVVYSYFAYRRLEGRHTDPKGD